MLKLLGGIVIGSYAVLDKIVKHTKHTQKDQYYIAKKVIKSRFKKNLIVKINGGRRKKRCWLE